MTRTEETIARIRAYAGAHKLRPARLAKMAGLHANGLRKMFREDWNPSADTLCKLEAVIPENFRLDAPSEAA